MTIVAERKEKGPAVVDIRDGNWQFGFTGGAIKKALLTKLAGLEGSIRDTTAQISREIGEDTKAIASLMINLGSNPEDLTPKALYIQSLITHGVHLTEEYSKLTRAIKGFNDSLVYLLSIEDMEDLGL